MPEKIHVYFSGRVQGVGFRFTARSLARRYALKGWISNLADGRVELIAQGEPRAIVSFLDDIRSEFKGYITQEEAEWSKALEEAESFQIRL